MSFLQDDEIIFEYDFSLYKRTVSVLDFKINFCIKDKPFLKEIFIPTFKKNISSLDIYENEEIENNMAFSSDFALDFFEKWIEKFIETNPFVLSFESKKIVIFQLTSTIIYRILMLFITIDFIFM